MTALLTVDDIEDAVGYPPATPEIEAQWQFYIDAVSAFINGYVDVSFEELADDVVRFRADYYGIISFGPDPVSVVTSVKAYLTGLETVWSFDGMSEIQYLNANEVVDVTYSHGYSAVPDEVKFAAAQAVLGALNLGVPGNLTSFTVGDVSESYSTPEGSTAIITLSSTVLNKYTSGQTSWRLGKSIHVSGSTGIPTL